jgi:purine-binding chemotaxis protein CheW
MREPAIVTSRRPDAALDAGPDMELGTRALLGFIVGGERYALPLSSIREILRPLPVTEVPRAGNAVMGIVSVRGTVTTLIDLRLRLKVTASPQTASNRILLVDPGNEAIGLLVDAVLQVYRLREDEIELAPSIGGDAPAHIIGVGRPGSAVTLDETEEAEAKPRAQTEELLVLLDPIALMKG